jgi:hypothetical protein
MAGLPSRSKAVVSPKALTSSCSMNQGRPGNERATYMTPFGGVPALSGRSVRNASSRRPVGEMASDGSRPTRRPAMSAEIVATCQVVPRRSA